MSMRRFNAWLHVFAKSAEYALALDLIAISLLAAAVFFVPLRLLTITGGV
jgi:uncharacterized membrane protein YdjX (TVP38/TMEM64 family)